MKNTIIYIQLIVTLLLSTSLNAQIDILYKINPNFYFTRINAMGKLLEKQELNFNYIDSLKVKLINNNIQVNKTDSFAKNFAPINRKKILRKYCEENSCKKVLLIEPLDFSGQYGGGIMGAVLKSPEGRLVSEDIHIGFMTLMKKTDYGMYHSLCSFFLYDADTDKIKTIPNKRYSKEIKSKDTPLSDLKNISEYGYEIATKGILESLDENVVAISEVLKK